MPPPAVRPAIVVAGLAAALGGCGADEPGTTTITDPPPPTTATQPPPATTIALTSSDRPVPGLSVPEWGARSTLTVRARRDGEPLAGQRVELLADPHPHEGDEQVVARATTSRTGHARLRARFDRDTRVRARIGETTSEPVDLLRGVRTLDGDVDELPGDRIAFSGRMTYPRDMDPEIGLAIFVGEADRPRLPRIDVRPKLTRLGKGSTRVAFTVPVPGEGWRLQVCLVPSAASGLSGPPGACRGRTAVNHALREQRRAERHEERELRERRRAERRADRGGG